jgi:hypothetical protein
MKQFIIDKMSDLLSRKFLALILSTGLLWYGKIDQMMWLTVVGAYLGANVADKYFQSKTKG